MSLELCRQGEEWICLLRRSRTSSLILLLGASGAVLYYLAQQRRRRPPRRRSRLRDRENDSDGKGRFSPRGGGGDFWRWLFAEELVEDPLTEDAFFLRSHYFGPAASNAAGGEEEGGEEDGVFLVVPGEDGEDREDCSLNCLSAEPSPKEKMPRQIRQVF